MKRRAAPLFTTPLHLLSLGGCCRRFTANRLHAPPCRRNSICILGHGEGGNYLESFLGGSLFRSGLSAAVESKPSVLMLRMQIALVCMVTLQTLLQTTYDNQYHQNSFAAWRELLFPTDFPVHYKGGSYTSYLYSIHDMQTFLNSIIRRYDGLEERSIDIVSTYAMRRPSSAIRRLMRSRLAWSWSWTGTAPHSGRSFSRPSRSRRRRLHSN